MSDAIVTLFGIIGMVVIVIYGREQTMKECGNCKHHKFFAFHVGAWFQTDERWACTSWKSKRSGQITDAHDTCEAWEERRTADE